MGLKKGWFKLITHRWNVPTTIKLLNYAVALLIFALLLLTVTLINQRHKQLSLLTL